MNNIIAQQMGSIGFNAGDQSTGDILSLSKNLTDVIVFRIDGIYVYATSNL